MDRADPLLKVAKVPRVQVAASSGSLFGIPDISLDSPKSALIAAAQRAAAVVPATGLRS